MNNTTIKKYELYLMLSSKLDEVSAERTIKDIEALLNKYKAKVIDIDKLGRQILGYPIKKEKEAYHAVLKIEAEPNAITIIKKQLDIADNVLRVGLFTLEEAKAEA